MPPRYDRGDWESGDGVFHAAHIADYSRQLARRLDPHLKSGDSIVVLGGDCSILLGAALALRRRGRYGLAAIDGLDFRHPDNSEAVGAAAGEDLALVTGRGQDDLTDMDGLRPYFRHADVWALGPRPEDESLAEVTGLGIQVATAPEIARDPGATGARVLDHLSGRELDGFWVHLDADVLDPSVMPAVDSPEPGGLSAEELVALLRPLLAAPQCAGLQVTIYDPDLDPDGQAAAVLAGILISAFAGQSWSLPPAVAV
ncbi:arginase [Catenulispora sp. GAS73]